MKLDKIQPEMLARRGYNEDRLEFKWQMARDLMASLPEKFSEADIAMGSVIEESVVRLWDDVKDAMKSLKQKWEKLSTVHGNIE